VRVLDGLETPVGERDSLVILPRHGAAAPRRLSTRVPAAAAEQALRGRYGDLVQAIGNTPLVELKRLSPKPGVRIWAKLESHNPTGSVKDRVARAMIEDAEEKGAIAPGQTILEPTSGNTGISLAMICARKGYPLKVVMPDNVTPERTQLLQMYGAEIVYSPGDQGSNGAVAMALEHGRGRRRRTTCPTSTATRPTRARTTTARRRRSSRSSTSIDRVRRRPGHRRDADGQRPALREELGDRVKIVAAEPMQGEPVQGLRSLDDGFIPPIIDLSVLDRKIFVTNRDAIVWTRKLLDEEGIFAGVSSGAIASIAVRIAARSTRATSSSSSATTAGSTCRAASTPCRWTRSQNLESTVWW
jgi:cysteine synthase B